MSAPTAAAERSDYEIYVAGGNGGGDCDANGNPVIDGALYIAQVDDEGEAYTVAGPFAAWEDAERWLRPCDTPCGCGLEGGH